MPWTALSAQLLSNWANQTETGDMPWDTLPNCDDRYKETNSGACDSEQIGTKRKQSTERTQCDTQRQPDEENNCSKSGTSALQAESQYEQTDPKFNQMQQTTLFYSLFTLDMSRPTGLSKPAHFVDIIQKGHFHARELEETWYMVFGNLLQPEWKAVSGDCMQS